MGKLLAASTAVACAAALLAPSVPAGASPSAPVAPAVAAAPAGEAGSFIGSINSIRASNGLGTLSTHGEITGVAQAWAEHMAAAGGISHNGSLPGQVGAPWTALGENVGAGTDVDSLMQAFMNSSSHRSNILDSDYNYIGVGIAWGGDGRLYTCHVFMGMGAPPPPEPEPEPDPGTGGGGSSGGGGSGGGGAGDGSGLSSGTGSRAEPAAPPPLPQGPAEPARVAGLLTALRSMDSLGLRPNSAAWRPLSRHVA